MKGSNSKTLALIRTLPGVVDAYYEPEHGYWAHTKGYRICDDICHTMRCDTVAELLAEVRRCVPCNCSDCKAGG